jgi:hypothetical protein
MNDFCTVCGEPRPCPAAREISEPAVEIDAEPPMITKFALRFPPNPSEKEQHNGK